VAAYIVSGLTLGSAAMEAIGQPVFITMLLLTVVGLGLSYLVVARRQTPLVPAVVVSLLVLYALYPRMHALYVMAVLPFCLLLPSAVARLVWVPGTIWYVLFNGMFGITGVSYFLAPLTGNWTGHVRMWPEAVRGVAEVSLILAYVAMCLISAYQLLEHSAAGAASARDELADEALAIR
jgi:hypothetical protein